MKLEHKQRNDDYMYKEVYKGVNTHRTFWPVCNAVRIGETVVRIG